MRVKNFCTLFVFLLAVFTITSLLVSVVVAKPVAPNPETAWPPGTIWGTQLHFENLTDPTNFSISEVWFGSRATQQKIPAPPDVPDGIIVEFFSTNRYGIWVQVDNSHENWPVRFRSVALSNPLLAGGTLSSVLSSDDTQFVPQDHSVVLEVPSLSLVTNLRKENAIITGLDVGNVSGTLYVDNAVNIQSIENLDSLTGVPGDNLRLRVTVKNTGRYTDNYTVSAGGSLDPTILNLAPGSTDNVIVTTTLPAGTNVPVVVTAAGIYATDQSYVLAGVSVNRGLNVLISPTYQSGLPGTTLNYGVTVTNTGNVSDIYSLMVTDSAGWSTDISPSSLTVSAGGSLTSTLKVTIPLSASVDAVDNITVTATSLTDNRVSNGGSCIAQVTMISHGPIYIRGNSCFVPANGVEAGSGTETDPYIIENYAINASSAVGIRISNTTAYFIVRNCFIEDGGIGSSGYHGIRVDNAINGTIENNIIENCRFGIYLYNGSNHLNVLNNTCNNDNNGIYVYTSCQDDNIIGNTCSNNYRWGICFYQNVNNNFVSWNTCSNNTEYGIYLYTSCNYNTLGNNTCNNNYCGIDLGRYSSYNNFINGVSSGNTYKDIYISGGCENNIFDMVWITYKNNGAGNVIT